MLNHNLHAGGNDVPFRYVHSMGFPGLLDALPVSLAVSAYQAGKFVVFRSWQGRLSMLLRDFDQAMGVAVDAERMAIGTRYQVWLLRNDPTIARQLEPVGQHDGCFLPRSSHVTGSIRIHEVAFAGDELWIVNTLFSCLCTLHPDYSFVPRWRPPFVGAIAAEDRCHLNGLAMADGRPRYVTVFGATDTREGWRPEKARGGCVIDVASGQVVAAGLSMPHSPRFHAGRLWVLDSGTGRVLVVDPLSGRTDTVAQLPGYTRGLAFHDRYAFVGLSRIRETSTFGGVPIAERPERLKCGVWVLEIESGRAVEFLEFERGVTEVFDVQVLGGIRFPAVVGFSKETIQGAFVLPPS